MTIETILKEIQELTLCEDAWIRERAEKVLRYQQQYDSGQLTLAEYSDLITDISRIELIQENANVIKFKAATEKLITTLISLLL